MDERFSRLGMLIGEEGLIRLKNARVALFGVGGVGGYALEALVRSGVGHIDVIDGDSVSLSNLNRQIIATEKTVGTRKVDAALMRAKDISPECDIRGFDIFYSAENADAVDFSSYDYVIDAIDTVKSKLLIIARAKEAGVPVISCMGTGNKLDPTKLQIADLYKTSVCPLARVMRYECRKRGIKSLKVLYSEEEPIAPAPAGEQPANGRRSIPGSTAFVPACAGLMIASQVVRDITAEQKTDPASASESKSGK